MDIDKDYDRARRLIEAATGDEWGDGLTVTDIGVGNAEPGYDEPGVWVMGDWNPKRWPRDDDAPLTAAESVGPRLARALETRANLRSPQSRRTSAS